MSLISKILKWMRIHYFQFVNSIAFVPGVIVVGFMALSVLMLRFDFSEIGKHIKSNIGWVSLRDAETARNITSTIAAGTISLLVFSFSMVMILLNQAATKMSNRVVTSMIGNQFQKVVLGFYVGTIVYALSLLSTIRNVDSGIYVPSLSIYLLILFTIADIFIFIYFLHYVTQSVKYEVIIRRVLDETLAALNKRCTLRQAADVPHLAGGDIVAAGESGYFQGFGEHALLRLCEEHDAVIEVLQLKGSFVLKGMPLFRLVSAQKVTPDTAEKCRLLFDFYDGQPIDSNPANGFHQLKEIAVKALSPGINDPGTALLSVQALTNLFLFRASHFPQPFVEDQHGVKRIWVPESSFEELFRDCFLTIWDYAKRDRTMMTGMYQAIANLSECLHTHLLRNEARGLLKLVAQSLKTIRQDDYSY